MKRTMFGIVETQIRVSILMCISMLIISMMTACGKVDTPPEKVRDLEYTIVVGDEIPEDLLEELEQKKTGLMKVTYADDNALFICIGYGEQNSGGYCITVKGLYETENAIYVDTNLCGPTPEEAEHAVKSYPYIVIKTEYIDKTVVFE